MPVNYKISLSKIVRELSLKAISLPDNVEDIYVSSKDVSRPGLELTGFINYFDDRRILIFGKAEMSYLSKFSSTERYTSLERLISLKPPAIIITRDIKASEEFIKLAEIYNIPILGSSERTSAVIASLVYFLNSELAPRTTQHGVLVEVYGEGVLITGDSGVGKSETAIELIKRGHRLVADDSVEIRRVSNNSLIGSAPENIRHFIELRGIGIINARRICGMGAVKIKENINMVVNLEIWKEKKEYDRLGVDSAYVDILGLKIPIITIPVKPGRNLAIIIEIAAMNNRQKKLGYNAAKELLASLGMGYSEVDDIPGTKSTWNI